MDPDPAAPVADPTDEGLFTRYRAGGPAGRDAFAALARRYERPLLGLALGILNHDRHAAIDAVQDTWLRVVRSAHTFDNRSALRTWLYRITINACKDARERSSQLPIPVGGGRGMGSSEPAMHEAPSISDNSADSHHPDLTIALNALPPDRRLLLLLCYHRGLTHPQAAEVLGIPLGTLKSRLNASLTQLRAHLREEAIR